MKLSAVIIARNEEGKIVGAIKSLKNLVDEILVVLDKNSIDKTEEVCKKLGTKVFKSGKSGYTPNRNFGLRKAKGEWILYIDADERVTPELKEEIITLMESEPTCNAFAIPRKNIIFGKELKHCGLWPDYVKRLYRRSKLKKWEHELHEEPVFEGEMGYLKDPLIHLKHKELSEMVAKTNEWSGVEAKLMYDASHPPMNVPRFLTAMFREFWKRMIVQAAFLDGGEGVIYALYQVYSRFVSYAKLWEMQLNK